MAKTRREIQRDYEQRTGFAAQKKYNKENMKQVPLIIPIKEFEEIDAHIKITKESRSGFIRRAIKETIKNDMK